MSAPTTSHTSDPTTSGSDRPRPWVALVTVVAMSTWPFLALVATNLDEPLELSTIALWWGVTVAAGAVVVALTSWRRPRWTRTVATVWAVLVWLVYSFPTITTAGARLGTTLDPRALWGVIAVIVLTVAVLVARRSAAQRFVTIAAVALTLATAAQLGFAVVTAASPADAAAPPPPSDASFVLRPDVWFIALDALASNDFLRERTGYDPVEFERGLTEVGFEFQHGATSNYPLTHLSLSSTLEMTYLYEGTEEPRATRFFEPLRGQNATVELMRANGYSYAHTYPGFWRGSRCSGVEDLCIGDEGSLTDTEVALAQTVPFGAWTTGRSRQVDAAIANDPSHVTAQVLEADLPGPTFTFLHALNPHAPYLRDPSCEIRTDIEMDFSAWGDGAEYAEAVRCLHRQLEDAVEQILDHDPDAVIVIQGDHGPRLGIDWSQYDSTVLGEDMHLSILSAIRLPAACDHLEVPDDLTSINTFRIVRACLEGTEPDLLPDRHFPIRVAR